MRKIVRQLLNAILRVHAHAPWANQWPMINASTSSTVHGGGYIRSSCRRPHHVDGRGTQSPGDIQLSGYNRGTNNTAAV